MTHEEALNAVIGAGGITVLSYQEAIEGYLKLRGISTDTPNTFAAGFVAGRDAAVEVARPWASSVLTEDEPALFQDGARWACTHVATAISALTPPAEPTASAPDVEGPWRDGITGAALAFDDGILNLNRDGSGNLTFREEVLEWETDPETGKDYRYATLPASEVAAIRDELNKWFPPAALSASLAREERLRHAHELIADFPVRENATAITAKMLQQISAGALGRQTVSQEALDWAEGEAAAIEAVRTALEANDAGIGEGQRDTFDRGFDAGCSWALDGKPGSNADAKSAAFKAGGGHV